MSKKLISALTAAILGATALSTPVMAGTSATAGYVSDYVFRGFSSGSGAANGSVDYSHDSGFSAGIWAIDLGAVPAGDNGAEFDIYGAYGMDMDSWKWSAGFTIYQYTESTFSTNELNLDLAAGDFSLAIDINNSEDSAISAVDIDGQHIALSWAANDVYSLTLAQNDPNTDVDDDAWTYLQAAAAGKVSEVDVSMTLGLLDEEDLAGNMNGYLVLSASKKFDGLGF